MEYTRLIGLIIVFALLASMLYTPVVLIAQENMYRGPDDGSNDENIEEVNVETGVNETERVVVFKNISFNELLQIVYIVRDVAMPMLNWSKQYNVTLADVIIRLGNYFIEKALNESSTNETLAKAHLIVAAIIYSHAPATAYPVLAKTIRENKENGTITNTTVYAILERISEIKNIIAQAEAILTENNITIPDVVNGLKTIGEGLENTTRILLERGYVKLAFGTAVKAYHLYVRIYGLLIKLVFIEKLGIRGKPDEPLTYRFVKRELKVLEKIIDKLPERVRERVQERVRTGDVKSWSDLRRVVREEYERYEEKVLEQNIDTVAQVMVQLIRFIVLDPRIPREWKQAVLSWLNSKGFIEQGMGGLPRIDDLRLYGYFRDLARNITLNYGVKGLDLLKKTIEEFSSIIYSETGVRIDIQQVFMTIIYRSRM